MNFQFIPHRRRSFFFAKMEFYIFKIRLTNRLKCAAICFYDGFRTKTSFLDMICVKLIEFFFWIFSVINHVCEDINLGKDCCLFFGFVSLRVQVESTDNRRDDILSYNDNVMGILK